MTEITPNQPTPPCRAPEEPVQPLDGIAIEYDAFESDLTDIYPDQQYNSAIAVPTEDEIPEGSRYEFVDSDPLKCTYEDLEIPAVVRTEMTPVH